MTTECCKLFQVANGAFFYSVFKINQGKGKTVIIVFSLGADRNKNSFLTELNSFFRLWFPWIDNALIKFSSS